jgi:hypothetical protein
MATAFLGARCGLANTSMHFTQFLASFFWSGIDVLGDGFRSRFCWSHDLFYGSPSDNPIALAGRNDAQGGPGNILATFLLEHIS